MENVNYRIQKPGAATWTDESGIGIPFNRLSTAEKTREKIIGAVLNKALKINAALKEFKTITNLGVDEIKAAAVGEVLDKKSKRTKERKGNYTFYNFDRTVKMEVNVNENIRFDDSLIAAAREHLESFIEKNVQGTDEVVRTLINSAFQNTKGGLDSKKVLSLMKYRNKIKAAEFQKALNLIEQSISRPSSKKYFRLWVLNADGGYENVDLNFSSL